MIIENKSNNKTANVNFINEIEARVNDITNNFNIYYSPQYSKTKFTIKDKNQKSICEVIYKVSTKMLRFFFRDNVADKLREKYFIEENLTFNFKYFIWDTPYESLETVLTDIINAYGIVKEVKEVETPINEVKEEVKEVKKAPKNSKKSVKEVKEEVNEVKTEVKEVKKAAKKVKKA